MRKTLIDSFKHFNHTTSLELTPETTYIYRCIILRLLYFIRDINIQNCIDTLHNSGIFIGMYDIFNTETHLTYKMKSLDLYDWIELLNGITVANLDFIFAEITEKYQNDVETSPLWNLKKIFEENNILDTYNPNLIIHTFLVLYNREINKDEMLYNMLSYIGNTNINDTIIRILGATNLKTYQKHIEIDLCIILKNINFSFLDRMTNLMNEVEVYGADADSQTIFPKNQTHRLSLLKIQKTISLLSTKTAETTVDEQNNNILIYYPNDICINTEKWNGMSYTERRILLLFLCINGSFFPTRVSSMNKIAKYNIQVDLSNYQFNHNRINEVTNSIYPLLIRCADCIDLTKTSIISLLNIFKENCYVGVFGVQQQKIMTTSFHLQLYIIAYLDKKIQIKCYKKIVVEFNILLKQFNPELQLVDYIPSALTTAFLKWCSTNHFSDTVIEDAIFPLAM